MTGALARGLVVWTALLAACFAGAALWTRPVRRVGLTATEAEWLQAGVLRALAGGADAPAPPPDDGGRAALNTRVWATLFVDDVRVARASSHAATLAAAARELADILARPPPPHGARTLTLAVERGEGRVAAPLLALSLRGGRDGLRWRDGDLEATLLPEDIVAAQPAPAWSRPELELQLGQRPATLLALLAAEAGRAPETLRVGSLRRVLFDNWRGEAKRDSGHAAATPPRDRAHLVAAARAAGAYLLAHQHASGQFDYEYYVEADQAPRSDDTYSLPRHAGTTYFLAQLLGHAGSDDAALRSAVERALDYLAAQHPPGHVAVTSAPLGATPPASVGLGASALALIAVSEHQLALRRLDAADAVAAREPWARRLSDFIVAMQRPDGEFHHVFELGRDAPRPEVRQLYYSGEAALALAKRRRVLAAAGASDDERRPLDAAVERAVRALVHADPAAEDRPFLLRFIFLEDHWTCIAADEAWDALTPATRAAARDYCLDFSDFVLRFQYTEDEPLGRALPDLVGAYGFSPLLSPHTTPVGSRSEALLSAIAMAERLPTPATQARVDALRAGLRRGLDFLLRHQLTTPARAAGGFCKSDEERVIRIDYAQHAGAALLRASAVTPPTL